MELSETRIVGAYSDIHCIVIRLQLPFPPPPLNLNGKPL
jgi:hypothetical protein